jgi:hypothetical protein
MKTVVLELATSKINCNCISPLQRCRAGGYSPRRDHRYKHDDHRTSKNSIRFRPLASVWPAVRSVTSETHLPASDYRFPAPDLESSMVKLVALLTTFSAGIFLVYAIEAYSDKAYRAHFSETHDLSVTKPGVDSCDVRNDVEDLTKDCPGFGKGWEFPP